MQASEAVVAADNAEGAVRTSRMLKNSRQAAVGALYERPFYLESAKYGRSQTAPTVPHILGGVFSILLFHFSCAGGLGGATGLS